MSETNGERSTGQQASKSAISHDQYDAALLDLDGVITDTASVHATCWKQMFNEYLRKRATQKGSPFCPFDLAAVIGLCRWKAPFRRRSRFSHIARHRALRGKPGRSARGRNSVGAWQPQERARQ